MANGANTRERADTVGGANIIEDTVDITAKLVEQLVQFYSYKSDHYKRQAQEHEAVLAKYISLEDFTIRYSSLPNTLNCLDILAQDRILAVKVEQQKYAFLGTTS